MVVCKNNHSIWQQFPSKSRASFPTQWNFVHHVTCFGHWDIDKYNASGSLKWNRVLDKNCIASLALHLATLANLLLCEQTCVRLLDDELQIAKSPPLSQLKASQLSDMGSHSGSYSLGQ